MWSGPRIDEGLELDVQADDRLQEVVEVEERRRLPSDPSCPVRQHESHHGFPLVFGPARPIRGLEFVGEESVHARGDVEAAADSLEQTFEARLQVWKAKAAEVERQRRLSASGAAAPG